MGWNAGSAVRAQGWMIRETFRQASAARLTWLMLGVTAMCVLFCAGIRIEGAYELTDDTSVPEILTRKGQVFQPPSVEEIRRSGGFRTDRGTLVLGFGLFRAELFRGAEAMVRFVMAILALGVAGALGTLLLIVWTGGFLPEFLHPSASSVLWAKPAPRWAVLIGKFVGVVTFAAVQAGLFIVGTFAALGLATGRWWAGYLVSWPLLALNFASLYAVSAYLASRRWSAMACILGTIGVWAACAWVNATRHDLAIRAEPPSFAARAGVETAYWILPKPLDLVVILEDTLAARSHVASLPALVKADEAGKLIPWASILSTLLFAGVMLTLASRKLERTDV